MTPVGSHRGEQRKAFVPADAVGPTDVGQLRRGKPSMPATLAVPDRHRRAIEGFVGVLPDLQKTRQVQEESLDELGTVALEAIEPRAAWRGGEGIEQVMLGVAVEVPLAGEPRPPGEDREGDDLALGKGCFGAGPLPLFWRLGLAEVVNRNVKCSEEGVLKSSMRSRFLSLRDR